jgi:hypothetical protein
MPKYLILREGVIIMKKIIIVSLFALLFGACLNAEADFCNDYSTIGFPVNIAFAQYSGTCNLTVGFSAGRYLLDCTNVGGSATVGSVVNSTCDSQKQQRTFALKEDSAASVSTPITFTVRDWGFYTSNQLSGFTYYWQPNGHDMRTISVASAEVDIGGQAI